MSQSGCNVVAGSISVVGPEDKVAREAEILKESTERWEKATAEEKALAKRLYPAPEDGMNEMEFYSCVLDAMVDFQETQKREPRTGQELDCYMNSADEFSAYLAAHPVTVAVQPTEEPANTEDEQAASQDSETKEEVGKALRKFIRTCGLQMDMNYRLAFEAADYVRLFLTAAPGVSKRSSAVGMLTRASYDNSDDYFTLPLKEGEVKHNRRVHLLLAVNAVVDLIGDGSRIDKGEGSKRNKRTGKEARLPWGKIRQLVPLVHRTSDDHTEVWAIHPSCGQDGIVATDLLKTICASPDLSAKEIGAAVEKIRREYAVAMKDLDEARKWGYTDPVVAKPETAKTEPAKDQPNTEDSSAVEEAKELTVAGPTATEGKTDPNASASTPASAPSAGHTSPCNQGEPLLETLANIAKQTAPKQYADMLLDAICRHTASASVMESLVNAFLDHPETDVDGWAIDIMGVLASHPRIHLCIRKQAETAKEAAEEEYVATVQ